MSVEQATLPETATTEFTARRKQPMGRILSHPQDIHCVVYNLFVLAAYGVAFAAYLNPEAAGIDSGWTLAAFVGAAFVLLGWISGVNVGVNYHNHVHLRVFRRAWMNRMFEQIWPITGGWPPYFWKHSHVTVHHANVLGEDDWTIPKRRADGSFEPLWMYVFLHWPWRYAWHLWNDFRNERGGQNVRGRFLRDLAVFVPLYSIPFLIDPLMGLLLWVLPHFFANIITAGGMYVQHVDCEAPNDEHKYRHSNTFHSRFFNLTMFNIGYHNLHHCHAHIHWSELPEQHWKLHEEMVADGAVDVSCGYYHSFARLASGSTWSDIKTALPAKSS